MDTKLQLELEHLFYKNQVISRLRKEFRIPKIQEYILSKDIHLDFAIDLLCQMVLHKRALPGTLIGILHKHFLDVGVEDALQKCADSLLEAAVADLVDYNEEEDKFIIRLDVSQDVYDDLERYQYPLPMVIPPRTLKSNTDTGHLTVGAIGSVILQSGNYHEGDVCLDHLNRVNQVELSINPDTARMIQNSWKNLDRQKQSESLEEYQARVKAFKKYDRSSRDVMEMLFVAGNRFFITHKYDKRGRTYDQGYHVNPQGNPWNKAVIEFAEKEIVR